MKMIKKLGVLALVCVMVLSLTANVFAAGTSLNTYKNLKYGYQLNFEKTWKLVYTDANSYSCDMRPVSYKGAVYPEIIVRCQNIYDDPTMDSIVKEITDQQKKNLKNYKTLSAKAVKTAMSGNAYEIVGTYKFIDKYDAKFRLDIIVKDDVLYQIIYAAQTKEFTKYEATFNTVLKTIKVNSGKTNTLSLPCVYTALSSDQVAADLSDKTIEDTDIIKITNSYGSEEDVTYDATSCVSSTMYKILSGKYNESTKFDKYSEFRDDSPVKQAVIELSKKYASLEKTKKITASSYLYSKKVIKVVKDSDGVTVGAIVRVIYNINDNKYNRVEGGTYNIYVKIDENGNAGVYGLAN